MAAEPSIDELIEQLKRIRIQEAQVIEQIERANSRETRRAARLRAEREQAARQAERDRAARVAAQNNTFQIGGRVRITNGVRAGQVETGLITTLTATRVSITTDDGSRVVRAYKNVTSLP
jgi:hypothetical protein